MDICSATLLHYLNRHNAAVRGNSACAEAVVAAARCDYGDVCSMHQTFGASHLAAVIRIERNRSNNLPSQFFMVYEYTRIQYSNDKVRVTPGCLPGLFGSYGSKPPVIPDIVIGKRRVIRFRTCTVNRLI